MQPGLEFQRSEGLQYIDGHFAQWAVSGHNVEQTMQQALDLFVVLRGNE
jgi:hypothetical protein